MRNCKNDISIEGAVRGNIVTRRSIEEEIPNRLFLKIKTTKDIGRFNKLYPEPSKSDEGKAGLDATVSRIIAIGFGMSYGLDFNVFTDYKVYSIDYSKDDSEEIRDDKERTLLNYFWVEVCNKIGNKVINNPCQTCLTKFITYYGLNFDIPFLLQRSAILGVTSQFNQSLIPSMEALSLFGSRVNIPSVQIVDLAKLWNCSSWNVKPISMKKLILALGIENNAGQKLIFGLSKPIIPSDVVGYYDKTPVELADDIVGLNGDDAKVNAKACLLLDLFYLEELSKYLI